MGLMTHEELVRRISRWMKGTKRMSIVMAELTTRAPETPDVIGWRGGASSILVECKASRADFLADKKKYFRRFEDQGMGDHRYFAAPRGVINLSDLPEGWGLLEVRESTVKTVHEPSTKVANKTNECVMLMSALRRVQISTAVYVVQGLETEE